MGTYWKCPFEALGSLRCVDSGRRDRRRSAESTQYTARKAKWFSCFAPRLAWRRASNQHAGSNVSCGPMPLRVTPTSSSGLSRIPSDDCASDAVDATALAEGLFEGERALGRNAAPCDRLAFRRAAWPVGRPSSCSHRRLKTPSRRLGEGHRRCDPRRVRMAPRRTGIGAVSRRWSGRIYNG